MGTVIKCKICGKPFFKNETTATDIPQVMYDNEVCSECNLIAKANTKNN